MIEAIELEGHSCWALHWVVGPYLLKETTISLHPAVGDDDTIVGLLFAAETLETNLDCHSDGAPKE